MCPGNIAHNNLALSQQYNLFSRTIFYLHCIFDALSLEEEKKKLKKCHYSNKELKLKCAKSKIYVHMKCEHAFHFHHNHNLIRESEEGNQHLHHTNCMSIIFMSPKHNQKKRIDFCMI